MASRSTSDAPAPKCACGHDFDAHGVRSDGGEYCVECHADCVAPEDAAGRVLTRREYEICFEQDLGMMTRNEINKLLAHDAALRASEAALAEKCKRLEAALREIAGSSLVCANPAEYLQAVARRALETRDER